MIESKLNYYIDPIGRIVRGFQFGGTCNSLYNFDIESYRLVRWMVDFYDSDDEEPVELDLIEDSPKHGRSFKHCYWEALNYRTIFKRGDYIINLGGKMDEYFSIPKDTFEQTYKLIN